MRTKWHIEEGQDGTVRICDGATILVDDLPHRPLAEFIVRACNSHDIMLAGVKEVLDEVISHNMGTDGLKIKALALREAVANLEGR